MSGGGGETPQGWAQNVQKQKEIPENSSIKSLKLQQWVGIVELLRSFVNVKFGREEIFGGRCHRSARNLCASSLTPTDSKQDV